jgi:hypothetical protein
MGWAENIVSSYLTSVERPLTAQRMQVRSRGSIIKRDNILLLSDSKDSLEPVCQFSSSFSQSLRSYPFQLAKRKTNHPARKPSIYATQYRSNNNRSSAPYSSLCFSLKVRLSWFHVPQTPEYSDEPSPSSRRRVAARTAS